jgi:hypothetical protein
VRADEDQRRVLPSCDRTQAFPEVAVAHVDCRRAGDADVGGEACKPAGGDPQAATLVGRLGGIRDPGLDGEQGRGVHEHEPAVDALDHLGGIGDERAPDERFVDAAEDDGTDCLAGVVRKRPS